MAKRYIPNNPFVAYDNKGRRRPFNPDRRHRDGTVGYSKDELKGLSKDQMASFRLVNVTGPDVIEEAVAVPGEKRSVTRRKKTESPLVESPIDQEYDEPAPLLEPGTEA